MSDQNDSGSKQEGADAFSPLARGALQTNGSTALSIKSLWKVFGKNPERVLEPEYAGRGKADILDELGCVIALQDASFDVAPGETFVVMGLSGSGKSTLVRCLIRLIEPTAGEVTIDGQDILQFDEKQLIKLRRSKVSMVFQHYGLLPHRKVLDNAAWGLEVQGIDKATRYARTQEVLDMVGLKGWERAYPHELSGGMQQRVGLARALAVDPDILLMDEPFSGLDPLIRRNMQDELIRLQNNLQKTIVFITHDLEEAVKLGDRIAIMRDGKIVQTGTAENIVLNPDDEYVGEFVRGVSKTKVMGAGTIMTPPDSTDIAKFMSYPCCTDPTTPIDNLVPLAAGSELPIAVVDNEQKLLGVISRTALLNSLAESLQAQQEGDAGDPEAQDGNGLVSPKVIGGPPQE